MSQRTSARDQEDKTLIGVQRLHSIASASLDRTPDKDIGIGVTQPGHMHPPLRVRRPPHMA